MKDMQLDLIDTKRTNKEGPHSLNVSKGCFSVGGNGEQKFPTAINAKEFSRTKL